MGEVEEQGAVPSGHGLVDPGEQRGEITAVQVGGEFVFHAGPAADGREEIVADHRLVTPRVGLHAWAADDEGYADAAFPEAALATAQALGGAFAALATATAAAIVGHVDHVGVLLEAQRRDGGQQLADAGVQVVSNRRPGGVAMKLAGVLGLELGQA